MRGHLLSILLFSFNLMLTCSCKSKDIIPNGITTEIKLSCYLTDFRDTTLLKEVWVGYSINYPNSCNFVGHCWNFNTDTLPTIKSVIRIEAYSVGWYSAHNYIYLDLEQNKKGTFRTGIPVSENDKKLIVRSFMIFNDSIVRYSDPLVLNNPIKYAN